MSQADPGVAIRPARPGEERDISALAFRAKASNGYDDAFMEACRGELTYRNSDLPRMLVAVDNEQVIGVVGAEIGPDRAEITEMWVDPGQQHRGIGRLLVEQVLQAIPAAAAVVVESDPEAVGFYERMGFSVVGTAPSGSISGRDLPLMALERGSRRMRG